ncbi:MAG: radical SAM protein [Acidobacteriota bacterium]|nr:radical SAM protein [Acidobacteriota bacterium]MDD8039059.1 radical SAM protein [Acidobacteriota bacterium]
MNDRAASIPDPPGTIFLELTSACNMHCAFCPSDVLRRPKEHLSEARLKSFLGQLHDLGLRPPVLLNILGEPLLNKKVYPLLDDLEAAGHPVTLITNMTLLGDGALRRELLRHGNLTLALSFQTATPRSYALRGYSRLPFRAYERILWKVIEDKFRLNSGARLEMHVASNYVMSRDATIQADGGAGLWANFPDEKAEGRWIARTLRRLERLAKRMKRKYPDSFASARETAAVKYRDHVGTKIAVDRAGLPPGFHRLKDEVFWGYMALPDVFLVFKSLELWTRDRTFLQTAFPPGRFTYVEERLEPRPCPMTGNLGLLAGGNFVLCCLDYEGEMDLGHIDRTPVADVLRAERRAAVRRDAMAEALCRRCRGNLFVFETTLLPDRAEQTVDKFGRGFWPREDGLHGVGGRWTDGKGWAYVYARLPARRIRLAFRSDFDDDAPLRLAVSAYDRDAGAFPAVSASWPLAGRKGRTAVFEAGFDFLSDRLYRIEIESPSFVPDETLGNSDTRRLGLAVYSISIGTTPAPPPEPAPGR